MDQSFVDGAVCAAVRGDGPPLFLLHSLLADRGSFARVEDRLAAEFRVIVPDLPGFGLSRPVAGGLEGAADRMAAAVAEVAPQGDAIVLGNGYGGFVALAMAIRHPRLAGRLVLADCGATFSEPGRAAFRAMAAAAAANGLAAVTAVAMRRLFAPEFQTANPELMRERAAAFERTDPALFCAACEALATMDLRPDLHKVRVPVLVLVGDEDEATPPAMSYELAAGLPDARLVTLPGCAHVPQMQAPDRFLAATKEFLDDRAMV